MKIYLEDNVAIPAVEILADTDPAPIGFTEATTVANFLKYWKSADLTKEKAVHECVSLITDWTNHNSPDKIALLSLIPTCEKPSVTNDIRADLVDLPERFHVFNVDTESTDCWEDGQWKSHYYYDERQTNPYVIHTLVHESLHNKEFRDINYKTELKSGNKLHDVQDFSADGFISKTEFYDGYIDPSNKGDNAIRITEVYTTDPAHASLYPSARGVETREKTRAWYLADGSLDESHVKITTKKYDTQAKKNTEGQRRRNNIINKLTENTAMGGIFSGVFADSNDAHVKLVDLMELHSGAFSTYITSGRGHIYDDLTAESNVAWLDTVVLDTQYTQAMIPQMIGMTLRNYILEKLKGNIL